MLIFQNKLRNIIIVKIEILNEKLSEKKISLNKNKNVMHKKSEILNTKMSKQIMRCCDAQKACNNKKTYKNYSEKFFKTIKKVQFLNKHC